jgi:rubrerythrin
MTKLFYLNEIIKFAIEKEKESTALYKELGNKTTTQEIKDLFHQLMLEEAMHEKFYTELYEATPKEQSPGVTEDAEYAAYMQALIAASRSVPSLDLTKLTNIKAALDYAADREKDSIVFYVGLKNYLPTRDEKKIDIIIKEEAKHLAKLLFLKKHLS